MNSPTLARSGIVSERSALVTASPRSLPVFIYSIDEARDGNSIDFSPEQGRKCRPVAAIGHVEQVDAGHHLEQLSGEMAYTPGSSRGHVDLARIGLRVSNEFGDILC